MLQVMGVLMTFYARYVSFRGKEIFSEDGVRNVWFVWRNTSLTPRFSC